MNVRMVADIIYNTSLLLALCSLFVLFPYNSQKTNNYKQIFTGLIVGMIGIGIMLNPFTLIEGVVFDVRSVLLVVAAMFFGLVPAAIGGSFLIFYRILEGGAGVIPGVTVIVFSIIIGVLWRHYRFKKAIKNKKTRFAEFYLVGILTHVAMLLIMFMLPWETAKLTLQNISIPVLIIYPLGTLLISIFLSNQIDMYEINNLLSESENRLRAIYDSAPVGICNTAHDGSILKANKKFLEFLGYDFDELKSMKFLDITHPEDIVKSKGYMEKLLSERNAVVFDQKRYIHKDGTTIYALLSAVMLWNKEGEPLYTVTTIMDITERIQLENEKNRMEAHLRNQQKLESVGTLASGVAHEINNPINGIMNYAQIILDNHPDDAETAEYAKEIIDETNRVASIVRSLLQFSRQTEQNYIPVDIKDIVSETMSLVKSTILKDNIDLTYELGDDLPKVICRKQEIRQVLMNLITNARDAVAGLAGEKSITISADVIEVENGRFLRLKVSDNGHGVPAAIADRIFDPFFTTKTRDKGTGLGLSISHGIIKEHGGQLLLNQKPGVGAEFIIELQCE